ncbi:MAG: site-2 protease family protein [Planctomycetales bacterium]|nr:site-2 protease family protein [Planctomycetales bacterium]
MHDTSSWSLSLGRWGGIQIRLHALFLLFAVLTLYLASPDLINYGLMSLVILFLSVLLHELAHCYTAFRVGGHADEVVIGPLGGLAPVFVPHEPQRELATALAGPLVNFVIWISMTPVLLMMGDVDVAGLLHPLRPHAVIEGEMHVVFLKLAFWLNWILLLVNLLPAFPFDGGRVLRSLLWPVFGYRPAIIVVARLAKVTALLLCVVAWFAHVPDEGLFVPAWVPLVLIALFLYFSAKQEVAHLDQQEIGSELFGYDFSQGYTSLERDDETTTRVDEPGVLQRWFAKRRQQREMQRRQQEADEESRVDAILARLHVVGFEGLTSTERALLKRVSARYRNRTKP